MKLHLITIGKPKLQYAQVGWEEYRKRLEKIHTVRVSHLADKYANEASKILEAAGHSYKVALVIEGEPMDSLQLAFFIRKHALEAQEVAFIIGGPTGLPPKVIEQCNYRWSLSELTFPHDLAMVIMLEALYRASTINAGLPYHRS